MAKIYAQLIKKELKTMEDVPVHLQTQVQAELDAMA